jgi:hypothetical protein
VEARHETDAQVREKLHAPSRDRHRGYRDQLAPVIPILEPVIRSLGYPIE